MPKENVYDEVLDRVYKRVENVSDSLAKRFGKVKPFNEEQVPTSKMFEAYSNLSQEDMQYLASRHPRELLNDFIMDMENYRRRQKNGQS